MSGHWRLWAALQCWGLATSLATDIADSVASLLDPEASALELGPMIHSDMEGCLSSCRDILYSCVEEANEEGFICAMDTTILLVVIVAAVLTGVLIPVACIAMCLCGAFTRMCEFFGSQNDAQQLIHSDMRHDWDTLPSSECPQGFYCNPTETQYSITVLPPPPEPINHLQTILPEHRLLSVSTDM